ncbi:MULTISPECIES: aspartate aminotransferase family protein [unclassified Pseudodesulfovibrio]|uniref:aspartate aminotransferase family protein n=1 Tax=unclassified Pseudodesulfovibrio TaxID=2661612 RepID=UPI000FEBBDC3|nr:MULTISPECIES: aspartate aminotransferase family protein [unclassified Pseudodesulfovibrio]MCJ2163874.1 aspartate aminotransferase family protein [Pseudodesulfovibrio sp. S3-i]RWU05880.1 aspartate aminotransferase family protein [Pseudodesulfovibrio sp. S3]
MNNKFEEMKERESNLLCHTYGRYPLAISRAKGCRLYDLDGVEYLDFLAGIAVCSLGHSRDDLADVMAVQARKMVHVSNLFYQEPQLELAEKLLSTCHAGKVFFCNSGAEANEGAIKLARRYMHMVRNEDRHEIITLEKSFHGRTLSTLTATGQTGPIKDGFNPLPEGFITVPFGNVNTLRGAVNKHTAAIMIEMVQGEGGVRPLPTEYVNDITAVCKENGILLIVDEVQTGLCRTGRVWAHQHYGITPDIFTSAKALANGLPMGAVLCTDTVARGFEPGSHATTFGGGAVVAAVASKVLDIMINEKMSERALELGNFARAEAQKLKDKYPDKIAGTRGLGLLFGIELTFTGTDVWKALLDNKMVCNLTQGKILRLVPPLTIEEADIIAFMEVLDSILATIQIESA